MTTFYGLAVAIYGTSSTKITSTVLGGETKDNIRVLTSQTVELEDFSTESVHQAFGPLEATVRDLAAIADESVTVPVVTGMEDGYNVSDLFRSLAHSYSHVRVPMMTMERKPIEPTIDYIENYSRTRNPRTLAGYFSRSFIEILKHAVDEGNRARLYFDPARVYISEERVRARAKDQELLVIDVEKELVTDDYKERLDGLLTRWEESDKTVLQDLHNCAMELGEFGGKMYQMANLKPVRYHNAHDELRGRLFLVPGAREAYAQPFISALGIEHNICVKGNLDPRSPPFADVTATIMGDYMDKLTGDKPGAVLVNHS